MPTLLLVRHGQASIHAPDYDGLSPLGWDQARALGRYLGRLGRPIHRVVTGPLVRQRSTTDALRETAEAEGYALPEPTVVDALAEFPAFKIVERVGEALARTDDVVSAGLHAGPGGEAYRRAAERIFHLWAEDVLDGIDDIERFAPFRARVVGALEELTSGLGHRETALVVTSGGPIGVTVGDVLGVPPARAIELAWEVYNGSFHEVRFMPGRRILARFNAIPHLEPDGLLTYV